MPHLPDEQPPNCGPSVILCQPGTSVGFLLLGLIGVLAVPMDYAYGGHLLNSSLQGQMEPKMVCVAQCTSSNLASIFSLQKIKHSEEDSQEDSELPATKRSWKEGEPEPPMLPEEIMEVCVCLYIGIESWDLRDYFALIMVASYFVSVICMSLLMSKLHVSEHMHSTPYTFHSHSTTSKSMIMA